MSSCTVCNRFGNIILVLTMMSFLSAGPALNAQEAATSPAAPAAAPAPKQDYSSGFAKFYQLGLPDVKNAKYVKLNMYSSSGGSRSFGLYDLQLSGNAWLIEEKTNGPCRFVVDNCRIIEVYDQKQLQKIMKEEQKQKEAESVGKDDNKSDRITRYYGGKDEKGRTGGTWKEIDLKKDVNKTLAYLKKKMKNEDALRTFSYSSAYGNLFLSCVHYYSHGCKDEANEIAALLFDISKDRRKVLTQALNNLADSSYDQALDKFFDQRDWAALNADLLGLLRKFPSGWQNALAVKMLFDKVREHVKKTDIPPLVGEDLTEEDQALAAELAKADNKTARNYGSTLWILADSKQRRAQPDDEKDNIIQKIKKRGVKSVPLLLALLKDDYMTRIDTTMNGGRSYHSYSSGTMTEERVREIYDSMKRPATRGDIAFQFLKSLPVRDSDRSERWKDRDALAAACQEWYGKFKDKSTVEMAKVYINSKDNSQQSSAMQYLIRNGSEEEMKLLEDHFLDSETIDSGFYIIQQFVGMRQEKAKDFLDKLEAKMKSQMESPDSKMFKKDSNKKEFEQWMKPLRAMVNVESAEALLSSVAAGKKSLVDTSRALMRSLAKEPQDKALTMILEAALKATDPEDASSLVDMAAQIPNLRIYNVRYQDFDEGKEEKEPKMDINNHAEQWKKLMASERSFKGSEYRQNSSSMTISDAASSSIEVLYGIGNRDETRKLVRQLGVDIMGLLQKRAAERLAGKMESELTTFPSADNVSKEQVEKLIAGLKAAKAEEISSMVAKISMDEQLALLEQDLEDADLNTRMLPCAHAVSKVTCKEMSADNAKNLEELKGRQVDRKMIEDLVALGESEVKQGNLVFINIVRQACFRGVEIGITAVKTDSKEAKKTGYLERGNEKAMISCSVNAGSRDLYGRAYKYIDTGALTKDGAKTADAKPKTAGGDELDALLSDAMDELSSESSDAQKEQWEKFWQTTDEFLKGAGNVCAGATIGMQGIPVLQKKVEDAEEGSESNDAIE